jgi:squalene monooxygenase
MAPHRSDIVIVGGGVAGCAAAVAFGKQGRTVVLLEKSLAQPERVVGELLQPGGVRALHSLGMGGERPNCYKITIVWPDR